MTSRINRQQATWPQPSKTEAVINTTQLYRKCVQHSPKTWEWEKWGWVGLVSVHFSPFGQKPFAFLRSVITGLVPGLPFRVELVHINLEVFRGIAGLTGWLSPGELAQSRSGAWWVGPLRLTCVGPGCLWRWWWGQVSWLWNIGQTERRMRRPWSCKSLMGLMLFYSLDNFLIILYITTIFQISLDQRESLRTDSCIDFFLDFLVNIML